VRPADAVHLRLAHDGDLDVVVLDSNRASFSVKV